MSKPAPGNYVALLRGVNVGGNCKLPMKDVAEMFRAPGCTQVQTFIQSGNVIFQAPQKIAAKIPKLVSANIEKDFGFRSPVLLRSASQLADVLNNNPFIKSSATQENLHVMFLADLPDSAALKALDPDRSPPDIYIVRAQEIYLQLLNGAAKTKLSNAYFDSKLKTVSTGRNWRTVTKLCELVSAIPV